MNKSVIPSSTPDLLESVLMNIIDQYTPRVPTVTELRDTPFIPHVLCGQQQVIGTIIALLENYRREKQNVSS